jgi:hypothetical protein
MFRCNHHGDYNETCWSCFNVNFNVNFKNFLRQFNCASVGKKTLIVCKKKMSGRSFR